MEEQTTKPHFALPTIFDNPNGWGPTEESIPRQFLDVPYAPYNKGDKVGKVADFGGYSYGAKMYGQRGDYTPNQHTFYNKITYPSLYTFRSKRKRQRCFWSTR